MSIFDQIRRVESGGVSTAKNPRSSAYGPDQFIKSTWRDVIGRMRPDLAQLPDRQLQALRADPNLSRQAAEFYMNRDISPRLQAAGFETTPANAYLGWFLGPGGATKALSAAPNTRVADILPSIIGPNANIKFGGKRFPEFTVSDLQNWSASKMGGASPPMPVPRPGDAAPMPVQRPVGDSPAYAQLAAAPQAQQAVASQPAAPVYANDFSTMARQVGNFFAPSLVDAPTPLTPEQIAAQEAAAAANKSISSQYGGAAAGLLNLARISAQPGQAPMTQMLQNEPVRGQYRPIRPTRGLL